MFRRGKSAKTESRWVTNCLKARGGEWGASGHDGSGAQGSFGDSDDVLIRHSSVAVLKAIALYTLNEKIL